MSKQRLPSVWDAIGDYPKVAKNVEQWAQLLVTQSPATSLFPKH